MLPIHKITIQKITLVVQLSRVPYRAASRDAHWKPIIAHLIVMWCNYQPQPAQVMSEFKYNVGPFLLEALNAAR